MNPAVLLWNLKPNLTASIVAALAVLLSAPQLAYAHADLNLQIEQLSAEILQRGSVAELYLKRAELHRRHSDWAAALADYERVRELNPRHADIDYFQAKMWLEANRPNQAKALIERFLSQQPQHRNALLVHARVLKDLGHYRAAARTLQQVINLSQQPRPDLFLEHAQTLASIGPTSLAQSLQVIEAAILRFGPLVSLLDYAIDLELQRKNPVAALDWWARLPNPLKQMPFWLARKAELLSKATQPKAACAVYDQARAALSKLPPSRRNIRAHRKLQEGEMFRNCGVVQK